MQTLPEPQLSTGVERTAYKYVASWGLTTPPTHTHLVAAVSGRVTIPVSRCSPCPHKAGEISLSSLRASCSPFPQLPHSQMC